jgi:uncharacterized membrane protein YfcA
MTRSIVGILIGFIVPVLLLPALTYIPMPPVLLAIVGNCVSIWGTALGGYLAAVTARHSPVIHALCVAVLSITVTLVVSHFQPTHSFEHWFSYLVGTPLTFTWGGLFRAWQISRHEVQPSLPKVRPG